MGVSARESRTFVLCLVSLWCASAGAQAPGTGEVEKVWQARYELRAHTSSEPPLRPLPSESPDHEGARVWATQRARLGASLPFGSRFRITTQLDVPASWLRSLYVDVRTPLGVLRAGQVASHFGLGILANDGDHPSVFGDAAAGDLVERIAFATKPLGQDSDWIVAVAGDLVFRDSTAELARGDRALQGVLATRYEHGGHELGLYSAFRDQRHEDEGELKALAVDLFARGELSLASGMLEAAVELAYVRGVTSLARTLTYAEHDIVQLLAAAQVGHKSKTLQVVLEAGYASGDANLEDGVQRRAVLDPGHRVGLILFPEVLARQSARTADLSRSKELFGRPARGSELWPTAGGVAGAMYLFPSAIWRPRRWLDARLGVVLGYASADPVDPFAERAESMHANHLGGDAAYRSLGLEVDAAMETKIDLVRGLALALGLEGGVLFPGDAFENAAGEPLGALGLLRARSTVSW